MACLRVLPAGGYGAVDFPLVLLRVLVPDERVVGMVVVVSVVGGGGGGSGWY